MFFQIEIRNLKQLWSGPTKIRKLENQLQRTKEMLQKIPFHSEELEDGITTVTQ